MNVAHHLERELQREDAGVLRLVFFQDVCLDGPADRAERCLTDGGGLGVVRRATVFGLELGKLLVNRGVQKHRQEDGGGSGDGHGDGRGWRAQVEPLVQNAHVIEGGDADARLTDLSVDVWPFIRVLAVERHGVEGSRQAVNRLALAQEVEPRVGLRWASFAGKHSLGLFATSLERKGPCGVGESPREILTHEPTHAVTVGAVLRQCDSRNWKSARARIGEGLLDFLPSDAVCEGVAAVGVLHRVPFLERSLRRRIEGAGQSVSGLLEGVIGRLAENRCGGIDGLQSIGAIGLSVDPAVVAAHSVRDVAEVAETAGRMMRRCGGGIELGVGNLAGVCAARGSSTAAISAR